MTDTRTRQPGDVILDKYFPDADSAVREAARAELKALVAVLYRITCRLVEEGRFDVPDPAP